MQTRAAQWKRKKIETVKEIAMDEAKLYLKYRRNDDVDDDLKDDVSMVNNDSVDETELNEFLSQFE